MALVRTAKEFVKHITRSAGFGRRHSHLAPEQRADRFSAIYDTGVWTRGRNDVPLSGEGSTIEATRELRTELPALLERIGATSLLDVGCGDFTWMQTIELPCPYIGVDIVSSVVDGNQSRFGGPQRRFEHLDVVEQAAPAADVVLCREVLFHLSLDDARAALRNMLKSGCRYLLLTSDADTGFNADIDSGDFRMLNLMRRPFCFPDPDTSIRDGAVAEGRFVGLWKADDVRVALRLPSDQG